MVSINTFDWRSLVGIRRAPLTDTIVMVSTVGVVLATSNLALGVLVGVLLSLIFFARKIAKVVTVTSRLDGDGTRIYRVSGQLFFVSSEQFLASFDTSEKVDEVVVDLEHAHLWDITAIEAIDKMIQRFRQNDTRVTLVDLNDQSAALAKRLSQEWQPTGSAG